MANLATLLAAMGTPTPAITADEQLAKLIAGGGQVPSPIAPGALDPLTTALAPQGTATGTGGRSAQAPTGGTGGIDLPAMLASLAEGSGNLRTRSQVQAQAPVEQVAPAVPQLPGPFTPENMPATQAVDPAQGIAEAYDYFTANIPAEGAAQPPLIDEATKSGLTQIKEGTDVATIMESATGPDEAAAKAEEIGFFDKEENKQLLLGLGIGLLQGKGLGDSVAMGVSMMQRAKAAAAEAPQKEAELEATKAKTALTTAQTAKLVKEAKGTGLTGKLLTGYRDSVADTVDALLTQDLPMAFEGADLDVAKAMAASTELTAAPDNPALQTIQQESLQRLFSKAWALEDEEERREAIDYLGEQFPQFDFKQFLK